MTEPLDHDRLFKELLTTFFWEFLELFAPEVTQAAERDSLTFLSQEIFNDLEGQERRNIDILAQLTFRGQVTCFLVHIENQSTAQSQFAERMFLYFSRLYEKYRLPIYPIALFSYDKPQRPEADQFTITFEAWQILQFNFLAIQLNRLNWRDFLRNPNPVAASLMAKMNFAPEERPYVKLECLRMIVTLQLDPARVNLLANFVDAYLRLNPPERQIFESELRQVNPGQEERIMVYVNSWVEEGIQKGLQEGLVTGRQEGIQEGRQEGLVTGRQEGIQEGRQEGEVNALLRMLRWRFGCPVSAIAEARLRDLSLEEVENLFEGFDDLVSEAALLLKLEEMGVKDVEMLIDLTLNDDVAVE